MTCVVDMKRLNKKWCAIPSENIPVDIRGVLEAHLALSIPESQHKLFHQRLREEYGPKQIPILHCNPGNQCLSWRTGEEPTLLPLKFPQTFLLDGWSMIARYPLEHWSRRDYSHLRMELGRLQEAFAYAEGSGYPQGIGTHEY